MDNRTLKAYDEFKKNSKEIPTSDLFEFGFTFAFQAGIKAENERIRERINLKTTNRTILGPSSTLERALDLNIMINEFVGED